MPISVTVEGDTVELVPDLCHELARALTWAEYGETVIPADAAPRGVITNSSGEHVFGGLLVSLDPNQPAPEYVESNAKPDVSEVRLILTQPVTADLDDLAHVHRPAARDLHLPVHAERGDRGSPDGAQRLLARVLSGVFLMAIKAKAELRSDINANLPDNTTGLITPALDRDLRLDAIDSLIAPSGIVSGAGIAVSNNADGFGHRVGCGAAAATWHPVVRGGISSAAVR